MPFVVPLDVAKRNYPDYTFVEALPPSEQKAAFQVQDGEGVDLCLKIISPDYEFEDLRREILALQLLSHPNVVRLIEYTYSTKRGNQFHYMVEEFVDGDDLESHLGPGITWTIEEASSFFSELFDGLEAINQIDVVHRDLKPSNIRVRPDGAPVIIDFGVARHLSLPDRTRTSDGAAIGTPIYFAPEQFVGTKYDIDRRTDFFAAGILLYQALVGKHPFYANNMTYSDLQQAVCSSSDCFSVPDFVSLPQPWKLMIMRLLEKERVRRPNEASQVAMMLCKLGGQ